jgi:hypothetical protein
MDSGLSDRMVMAMDELRAEFDQHPTTKSDHTEPICLSNAQNEVLRPELVEFFKTTVEDQLTSKVRA